MLQDKERKREREWVRDWEVKNWNNVIRVQTCMFVSTPKAFFLEHRIRKGPIVNDPAIIVLYKFVRQICTIGSDKFSFGWESDVETKVKTDDRCKYIYVVYIWSHSLQWLIFVPHRHLNGKKSGKQNTTRKRKKNYGYHDLSNERARKNNGFDFRRVCWNVRLMNDERVSEYLWNFWQL